MKKEEPDAAEPKQEPMETEEKKPIKVEPKEEEESGANSTSTASTTQNRKKSKNTEQLDGACNSGIVQLTLS